MSCPGEVEMANLILRKRDLLLSKQGFGRMLGSLAEARRRLLDLLEDADAWETLDVTYHPPHVQRLWRPWKDGRLYLHRIEPCPLAEALLHPHPWPSAVSVETEGYWSRTAYEMEDGMVAGHSDAWMPPGSVYEMPHRDTWHSVAPAFAAAMTVMVTGPLFRKPSLGAEKPPEKQRPLSDKDKAMLMQDFMDVFRAKGDLP